MTTAGSPHGRLSRRQAWLGYGRTDASGGARPGAYLEALRARIAAEDAIGSAAPPDGQPQWNPLGPAGVGKGQADGEPRVSGRVTSIAVEPGGQRAYIGAANGGTWYTDDGGTHWRSLDTYAQTPKGSLTGWHTDADALAVGAIEVVWDPGGDPAKDVVYVGTGEANRSSSFFGIGVRVATGPAAVDPLDPTKQAWTLEANKREPDGNHQLAGQGIYRLAADKTGTGTVYAATTRGLWRRGVDPVTDAVIWEQVFDPPIPPANAWGSFLAKASTQQNPILVVTDVVIAQTSGATPQTIIYAAVQDQAKYPTRQQVWQSATGDPNSWQQVPGFTAVNRVSLAVAPSDLTVVYALARGEEQAGVTAGVPTSLARLAGGTFKPVSGTPPSLSGGAGKRGDSDYCTLVAVDPANPNVLWLAGTGVVSPTTGEENATLFRAELKNPAPDTWSFGFDPAHAGQLDADTSWVGGGAHSDVHALAFSGPAAASTVWLGCDGGVFQCQLTSPAPPNAHGTAAGTAPGPWRPLNNGLAITQPIYLAQTSISDFLMLAGTQDNGVAERTGTEVWTRLRVTGDGGGCAIDDSSPARRFAQYTNFAWYTVGAPGGEYARTLDYSGAQQPFATAWKTENDQSAFASQAAARPLQSGKTALAFGSHRVWYCEDWGQGWNPAGGGADSWCTLPSGKNPYHLQPSPDNDLDSLNSQVVRVAFADDDNLLVLAQAWPENVTPQPGARRAGLYLFTRTGAGWLQSGLSEPAPGDVGPTPTAGPQPRFPDGEIPKGLAVDLAVSPPACYVCLGTGRRLQGMDHVWWYDGKSWWPCKPDPQGSDKDLVLPDISANAVAVDADRTVYVGTDVGVWKGVHTTAGAAANWWKWTPCSNGLPESPVTDLLILSSPHLLRAATFGRGVWEFNLDETASTTETYLRAHVADTRRVFPAAAVPADKLFGPPESRLDASPDIIVSTPATAAVSSPPPSSGLPLARARRPRRSELVRVLQYALRRRQDAGQPAALTALPPLVIDGYFGRRTAEAVRAFQGANGTGVVNAADWQAIVTAPYIDALAGATPTYLDMALLDQINPVPAPVSGPLAGPSLRIQASAEVYVQVNARGWQRRPAGTVRLGLLATPAFDATLSTLPALPGDWIKQFTDAFTTEPSAPWLTGSTDWAWIGSPATLATTRALHPEEPQVVRFTTALPLPPGAATLPALWTLLAVVHDPLDDLATNPSGTNVTSVSDLVLNYRYAGARSVQLDS